MESVKSIEYIPIEDLIFDPDNPRLPEVIRQKKNTPEYEGLVLDWMLDFENITELMGSIGEKGFFPAEPLLVVKTQNSKYEVVEGNRRLTAVKILNNPGLATRRKRSIEEILAEAKRDKIPTEIPCVKFDKREEVLAYLGYKHITGVQEWDSLAKAKYLKQLLKTLSDEKSFAEKCRTLAKIIGSKANYVKLLLVGVDVYSKIEESDFFGIKNLGEENFEFGVFYTALNRANIAKYVGVDFESERPIDKVNIDNLKDLTKWVFEETSEGFTRLGESRNLPKLDKILDSKFPKALEAFKGGKPLDEASRLTDHPVEIFGKNISDSMYYLEVARNVVHEFDDFPDEYIEKVTQITKLARMLNATLNDKKISRLDEEA